MSEYKYYFNNSSYIVPRGTLGKGRIAEIKDLQKPGIVKSISDSVHEVDDKLDFYSSIPGKYHVIVYEFENKGQKIKLTKYKPLSSSYFNICLKANIDSLKYFDHKIVQSPPGQYKILTFDIQDFFDYNFEFFSLPKESNYAICDNDKKTAQILFMSIEYENSDNQSVLLCDQSGKILKPKTSTNINDIIQTNEQVVCFDAKQKCIMIWKPANQISVSSFVDDGHVRLANGSKLFAETKHNLLTLDIFTQNPDEKKVEENPNILKLSDYGQFKQATHNAKMFGSPELFKGEFDFMTKIHRNYIRNLYDKYLYINVLDVGIGKCRDVFSYSQYVNRSDIYGVEPNPDFSKFCTIANMYNSTADDIFKLFKEKKMTKKFHTIVFCNSYNFVTDPFITMKECEEVLEESGRIIMIYMNNDKVVTVKNKAYEIRKGESNKELPPNSPLVGRQNFIEVFNEVTLVPPHYENQISEGEILGALEKLNAQLTEQKKPKLELLEKSNMIHPQYSSWLTEEAKLFNSMFYYVVVGRPCKQPELIIAFDPLSIALQNFINYLHKKRSFCNGVEIIRYDDKKQSGKTPCICVTTVAQYEELSKNPHELLINIQDKNALEYSSVYNVDFDKFISERKKLLEKNPKHIKFGFPENDKH